MRKKLAQQKAILVIATLILVAGAVIGLVLGTARANMGINDPLEVGESCRFNSTVYEDQEVFESTDGCNTCTCNNGRVLCTARACKQDLIPDLPI